MRGRLCIKGVRKNRHGATLAGGDEQEEPNRRPREIRHSSDKTTRKSEKKEGGIKNGEILKFG